MLNPGFTYQTLIMTVMVSVTAMRDTTNEMRGYSMKLLKPWTKPTCNNLQRKLHVVLNVLLPCHQTTEEANKHFSKKEPLPPQKPSGKNGHKNIHDDIKWNQNILLWSVMDLVSSPTRPPEYFVQKIDYLSSIWNNITLAASLKK